MDTVLYEVCRLCFEANPADISLVFTDHQCRKAEYHGQQWPMNNVNVVIVSCPGGKKLEEVRPKPKINLPPGKKFVLCHGGSSCRGPRCTFAHSLEERNVWNQELEGELNNVGASFAPQHYGWRDYRSSQNHQKSRHMQLQQTSQGDWPKLPSKVGYKQQKLASHSTMQAGTWQLELEGQEHSWSGLRQHSQQSPSSELPWTATKQESPKIDQYVSSRPQAKEMPSQPSSESARLSKWPSAAVSVSELESKEFGTVEKKKTGHQGYKLNPVKVKKETGSCLYSQLTASNYQEKFNLLVKAEKEFHEGILRMRCNGLYTITFAGITAPSQVNVKHRNYKFYAYIDGLSSDNLSYVNQASDSISINGISADIYKHWYARRLVAAFKNDCSNRFYDKTELEIKFNLKESYFQDLENSVRALKPNVISRIMPAIESSFGLTALPDDLKDIEHYCSEEQIVALHKIVTSPSNGPPLLLAGAFGTGKSRLLALCVRYFQKSGSRVKPVRVLVCTQQRVSADKFLEYYIETWVDKNQGDVCVIREYGFKQLDPKYESFYMTSKEFQKDFKRFDNVLVITTCLTAPHLSFITPGYFTHIFIDEGSQMREPEAVAPLCLATSNTKIIIAGDQNQVGPALLVLGDIPQKNGLGISLLERLQVCYQSIGGSACDHIATLSANYRCHKAIVELVGGLFYNSQLTWAKSEQPPLTHRQYEFPLVFVCCDNDRSGTFSKDCDQQEADVIVEKALSIARSSPPGWGKPSEVLQQLFLVSPCEKQVSAMKERFKNHKELPDIKSTINIQGREFQAVFLSTTEPTNRDGSTRNPTRSLCDPYVFNTALTRAKSLVVAVGNPFLLLSIERQMAKNYSSKKTNCWSTFLKACIDNDTMEFSQNAMSVEEQGEYTKQLCLRLQELNSDQRESQENLALKKQISDLEALLSEMRMVNATSQHPANSVSKSQVPDATFSPEQPGHRMTGNQATATAFEPGYYHASNDQVTAMQSATFLQAAYPALSNQATAMPAQQQPYSSQVITMQGQRQAYPTQSNQATAMQAAAFQEPGYVSSNEVSPRHLQTMLQSPPLSQPQADFFSQSDIMEQPDYTNADVERVTPMQEYEIEQDLHQEAKSSVKDYYRKSLLGKGGFGVVHHVLRVTNGTEYALKIVTFQNEDGGRHDKRWREVDALKALRDNRIVQYFDSWVEEVADEWWCHETRRTSRRNCLCILMELCEKDTLKHWLLKNRGEGSRNKKAMVNFFEQILDALCFIHEKGYIHRDLKPSNILFVRNDDTKLKIGDFGLVTSDQPPAITTDASGNMERPSGSSYRGIGTFPYISPEQQNIHRRRKVDAKTDIYALGIILFELHYPKPVDEDEKTAVFGGVRDRRFPPKFKDMMAKIYDLVLSMTAIKPYHRPSALDIQKNQLGDLKRMSKKARRSFVPVL